MDRLPLFSLIPRLIAHRSKRRVRRQRLAFHIPVDRQRAPYFHRGIHDKCAVYFELPEDLDFVSVSSFLLISFPVFLNDPWMMGDKTYTHCALPLIRTFPIDLSLLLQVKFPLMSMLPYASIRSLTWKSPEKVTAPMDLTEPSTSIGPRSSMDDSDLTLFFFLTATAACWTCCSPVDDEATGW